MPGTGIPSGIDSGLCGFSHGTSRRRLFCAGEITCELKDPDLRLMACQVVFHLLEQFRTALSDIDIEGGSFVLVFQPGGVQRPSVISSGGESWFHLERVPSPPRTSFIWSTQSHWSLWTSSYDPDFGFAFRGSAFDNQSSAPPARSAGVKNPYVHLLESQSAMSMFQGVFNSSCCNNSTNKLGKIQINLKLQGSKEVRLEHIRKKWRWMRNDFQLSQRQDGNLGLREEKNCQVSMMLMDQNVGKLSMQTIPSDLVDHLNKWCGVNVYSTSFSNSSWATAR